MSLPDLPCRRELEMKRRELADLEIARDEFRAQENQLKKQVRLLSRTALRLLRQCKREKAVFNELKAEALAATGELTEELVNAFRELPSALDEVEAKIEELKAQIDQIGGGSDKEKRFKEREVEIAKLQADIEGESEMLSADTSELEEKKNRWLPRLQQIIKEINEVFSSNMTQIRCLGEVALEEAGNDFGAYKVVIRVKFRDGEEMQALNGMRHSGGEQSVTTMLYLIALQRLTRVPFRVVDEINQGMDPDNERLVFEQIVKFCCAKDSCQTFLITPKLQSDLLKDVTENVRVLCVYSGPFMPAHTVWDMDSILQSASAQSF